MKRVAQTGPTIREQLRAMDDAAVVTSFLGGEERAFQEPDAGQDEQECSFEMR